MIRGLVASALAAALTCGCGDDPAAAATREARVAAARGAFRGGRYMEADRLYREAFALGAPARDTLVWRSRALIASGRLDAALEATREWMLAVPDDDDACYQTLRLQLLTGRFAEAWETFEQFERRRPATAEFELLRAGFYLALGYADRAEAAVAKGYPLAPGDRRWAWLLAHAELQRGYLDLGRDAHRRTAEGSTDPRDHLRAGWSEYLLGHADSARRAYDIAVAQSGRSEHNPAALSMLSDFLLAAGELEEAQAQLAALRDRLSVASTGITRRFSAAWSAAGDQARAQAQLEPYLAAHREDSAASRALGLSLLREGRSEEGLEHFESMAAADPLSPATQYLLGVSRLANGQSTRARAALDEARRLQPDGAEVDLALALVAMRDHRWFDARFEARRRLEKRPGDFAAGLVWAASYLHAGDPTASWYIRQRLLGQHPRRRREIKRWLPIRDDARPGPGDEPPIHRSLLDEVFPRR